MSAAQTLAMVEVCKGGLYDKATQGRAMTDVERRYLGDGLYASFDGFMFTLRAPRRPGDHWVGLRTICDEGV